MKKRALLIANTNILNGTKKDIIDFMNFLRSYTGGAWNLSEIFKPLYNPSKQGLLSIIETIKREKNDYVIVLFSGHGGHKRELLIEINETEEKINESDLKGIAKRQLTIFDCCRNILQENLREDSIFSKSQEDFSDIKNIIREKFDERIMQAAAQQVTLFSCSVGQSSYDTNNGAVYLSNFIKAAKNVSGEFKTVGLAHQESIEPTYQYSLSMNDGVQRPDASLPKCLTEQQLIISINPSKYVSYS